MRIGLYSTWTRSLPDPFPQWSGERMKNVRAALGELAPFANWEFCRPARRGGQPAGIDFIHEQTELALEYMRRLRGQAKPARRAGT